MKGAKKIDYYLKLPWDIKLKKISDKEGGGWYASIPLLGEWRCIGDGETREEALENLDKSLKQMIEDYIKRGYEIPEPSDEEDEKHSGRILIRVPPALHSSLVIMAKNNRMSLNSYLVYLLSGRVSIDQVTNKMAGFEQKLDYCVSTIGSMKERYTYSEIKTSSSPVTRSQVSPFVTGTIGRFYTRKGRTVLAANFIDLFDEDLSEIYPLGPGETRQ